MELNITLDTIGGKNINHSLTNNTSLVTTKENTTIEDIRTDIHGTKYYYLDGKLHRVGGPAIKYIDGTKYYYLHGKLHRVGGPAIKYIDGTRHYYLHGKLHSIDWSRCNNDELWLSF